MLRSSHRKVIGVAVVVVCAVVGLALSGAVKVRERPGRKTQAVHVVLDEAKVMNAKTTQELIEPLWWRVEIHDSWTEYERTLRPFSVSQRHLLAIEWYRAEVNNGGHEQFFSNSTGIVTEHAVLGLDAVGLPEAAEVLREAARRIGGASRDRDARNERLEAAEVSFDDLDNRFYELEGTGALDSKPLAFARAHVSDFLFEGDVEEPVFPRLPAQPSP